MPIKINFTYLKKPREIEKVADKVLEILNKSIEEIIKKIRKPKVALKTIKTKKVKKR